jgi:hypothetical protein
MDVIQNEISRVLGNLYRAVEIAQALDGKIPMNIQRGLEAALESLKEISIKKEEDQNAT